MVGLLLCVSHFDQIFGVKRLWQSVSAAPLHCMSHVKEEFSSLHSSLGFFFFMAGGSLHLSMTVLFGKLSFLMSLIPQTRILLKIQQTKKNIYLLAG